MAHESRYDLFVGVDVAASTFTATWSTGDGRTAKPCTYPQTPRGFAAFQEQLLTTTLLPARILVVLEATGSYWVALAVALHEAGYDVSVVNPLQIVNYAKSLPRRSKTDARDAQLLTQYAWERQPPAWAPPPRVYHELRQRLVARDAFVEMRQQARNHRHALLQWPVHVAAVKDELDAVIADFDDRITTLEQDIRALLRDGAWAESARLLQTIKSVGPLTAAWLLVLTLNFEQCSTAEALAAYAGLAPVVRESGSSVRGKPRVGPGGNKRLRTVVYVATFNAARFNPVIRAVYQRLVASGKPKKVARCAAARKLLQVAWAVVTTKTSFDPQYGERRRRVA